MPSQCRSIISANFSYGASRCHFKLARERAKFCVSGRKPVMEENGELSERVFPLSCGHNRGEVGVLQCEINKFESGIVGRKGAFGFYDLTDLTIHSLDGVGGVDDAADVWGIGEKGDDIVPMPLPQKGNGRIFSVPG